MKIRKAVWPERSCRDAVWGQWAAYTCELPDLHKGPCVSLSVKDSITRREQWEKDQDAAEAAQNESEAPIHDDVR
jgi:hypothetical protein